MNRGVRALWCLAAGLALAGCPSGWVTEDSGVDVDLRGVWTLDGETAFAVGQGGTVLMREGGKWRQLRSGTANDLYGVWGTSATHAVVVGDAGTALQWDGPVEPPDPPPPEPLPDLRALSSQTPANFRDIHGSSASWALIGSETSLQYYNGSELRDISNCGVQRIGVHVVQDTVFAAGPPELDDEGTVVGGGLCMGVINTSWTRYDPVACPVELEAGVCPLPDTQLDHPVLWGVWVGEGNRGVVVGSAGYVWGWPAPEAGTWLPQPSKLTTDLRAVDGHEQADGSFEAYAVGDYGAALRIKGRGGRLEVSGEPIDANENLYGVSVSPDGAHAFVVGARGVIFHLFR